MKKMERCLVGLFAVILCGCGSILDPTSGSGPFPVTSHSGDSVANYRETNGKALLRIRSGFLIGGHVELSQSGEEEDFYYFGVLGQSSDGRYYITTPATRAHLRPEIYFSRNLQTVRFSWADLEGKFHAREYQRIDESKKLNESE